MDEPTFDVIFERIFERILERNVEKLATANTPRMMSMRRAAAYLDVTPRQLSNLFAAWGIRTVQYRAGGNCYVEREEIDRMIERLKSERESRVI
jgi:hypothetical protein